MSLLEVLTAAKEICLSIAALTTATVAILGLKSWRRELRGKANFDIARSLAKATYKLRDEIEICRSPFIWAEEFPEEYRRAGSERAKKIEVEGHTHVFSNRWSPVLAALREFDTQALEAEALWGCDARERSDALRDCIRTLRASIDTYVQSVSREESLVNREFQQRIENIVFAPPGDRNGDFSKRLLSAVSALETILSAHLRRS